MPGSNFQVLLLPLLENLKEKESSLKEIKVVLLRFVELSDETLKPFDPEKDEHEFQEAILLAREHLIKADLIETTGEDRVRITALGKLVLNKRLNSIDIDFLRRLPGYIK